MQSKIQQITSDQFLDKIILKKANALVKISMEWNGAGQMLGHTLQDLSLQYSNRLDFFDLEYEAESVLSAAYRVDTLPTILFFKKGTLVDKLSGLNHRMVILHKINKLINA